MFENIGMSELLIILLIVLVFFGPKKIPELAQGIGKGLREFRKATRDIQDSVESQIRSFDEKPQPSQGSGPGVQSVYTRCPKCATENPAGSKFCKECGAALTEQSLAS